MSNYIQHRPNSVNRTIVSQHMCSKKSSQSRRVQDILPDKKRTRASHLATGGHPTPGFYPGWIPIRFLFSAGFGSYFRVSVLIYRVSVLIFSGFGFYFVRFRYLFNCGIVRVSVLILSRFGSYLGGVFVSFGSYFTRFGSYLARVRLGLGWG